MNLQLEIFLKSRDNFISMEQNLTCQILLDLRNLQEQVKKLKIIVALGERFNVFLTSKASISKFVVVQ